MSTVNSLISQRLKKNPSSNKMLAMAEQSATGNRSSFSGLFQLSELSEEEKTLLEEILERHGQESKSLAADLKSLEILTKEVKALNHQAALLHGERIKKARELLKPYRQGAFSAWLKMAYGNRQTPYNLLLYFEFWQMLPRELQALAEKIPRQAIYTLASREIPFPAKKKFVEAFSGETKAELLEKIRIQFPLKEEDLRQAKQGQALIFLLQDSLRLLKGLKTALSREEKREALALLSRIKEAVHAI